MSRMQTKPRRILTRCLLRPADVQPRFERFEAGERALRDSITPLAKSGEQRSEAAGRASFHDGIPFVGMDVA